MNELPDIPKHMAEVVPTKLGVTPRATIPQRDAIKRLLTTRALSQYTKDRVTEQLEALDKNGRPNLTKYEASEIIDWLKRQRMSFDRTGSNKYRRA